MEQGDFIYNQEQSENDGNGESPLCETQHQNEFNENEIKKHFRPCTIAATLSER